MEVSMNVGVRQVAVGFSNVGKGLLYPASTLLRLPSPCPSFLTVLPQWASHTVPEHLLLTTVVTTPKTYLHHCLHLESHLSRFPFFPTFCSSSLLHFLSFYSFVVDDEIYRYAI